MWNLFIRLSSSCSSWMTCWPVPASFVQLFLQWSLRFFYLCGSQCSGSLDHIFCADLKNVVNFLPVRNDFLQIMRSDKFWEELIVYFPWYDTGHIENDASNDSSIVACVFVPPVRFLPSRCLATIRGFYRAVAYQRKADTHTCSNVIS
jgi:hypothetical protein